MKKRLTFTIPGVPMPFVRWNRDTKYINRVYILVSGKKVVYVGSTNALHIRQCDYGRSSLKHDAVFAIETATRGEAYDCESWLIEYLKPKHNRLRKGLNAPDICYPPFFTYGQHISFAGNSAPESTKEAA